MVKEREGGSRHRCRQDEVKTVLEKRSADNDDRGFLSPRLLRLFPADRRQRMMMEGNCRSADTHTHRHTQRESDL